MKKMLLIDGNSIVNRAFYAIMGNKMLMIEDGTYTNGIYGFLSILFKTLENIKPEYLMVSFDLKGPTKRNEIYKEYKANRKGMPEELKTQMPILKEILKAMNIKIIEKEGYEADDILGTVSKWGEKNNLEVKILTGDKDSFQLVSENINIILPRTKMGKTETEDINLKFIKEKYLLEPKNLIEVKGLMGDQSDNIPGVPGVGEKTALKLIQKYKTIDNIYINIEKLSGKLKEKLEENKKLAYLSRKLGIIDLNIPIKKELELDKFKILSWKTDEVLTIFKKLKFNKYISKFNLLNENIANNSLTKIVEGIEQKKEKEKSDKNIVDYSILELEKDKEKILEIIKIIEQNKKFFYFLNYKEEINNEDRTINKYLLGISIYIEEFEQSYYIKINNQNNELMNKLKKIYENKEILKISCKQKENYILLKENNINPLNLMFDVEIAAYLINSNINNYDIKYLAYEYLRN